MSLLTKSILTKFDKLAKATYLPIVNGAAKGAATDSRYGGETLLLRGEPYPKCGSCNAEMNCLLQLDIATLPATPPGMPKSGLLQIFRCANESSRSEVCRSGEDWEAFANTKLCRILPAASFNDLVSVKPQVVPMLPERAIIAWKRCDKDYPHDEEEIIETIDPDEDEIEEYISAISDLVQVSSDKLLGWPNFVQGVEYADCPLCQEQMEFLYSMQSETITPACFGDAGAAIVFICAKHPDMITYNWACS